MRNVRQEINLKCFSLFNNYENEIKNLNYENEGFNY
jgi:hypothetical protein